MKYFLSLSLFLLLPLSQISPNHQRITRELPFHKANFNKAFEYLIYHEGYYSNNIFDKGGETYCGISRTFNKNWGGWWRIDLFKKRNGRINSNQRIEDNILDFYVKDFYSNIWTKEGFNELNDQNIANYIFDFRINATVGSMIIQDVVNENDRLGYKIAVDNVLDDTVMCAINNTDSKHRLMQDLKNRRIEFYNSIALRHPSQRQFLSHWLYRAKKISLDI